jgi:effector-binding domain-containing protein
MIFNKTISSCLLVIFSLTAVSCDRDEGKESQPQEKKRASRRSPEAVVEAAIQAAGGSATLRNKTESYLVRSKGTFYGRPYEMTTIWSAPDKIVMSMDGGEMVMGYVGEKCWNKMYGMVVDCQEAEKKSAKDTLLAAEIVTLYPLVGPSFELKSGKPETIDGKAAEVVVAQKKSSDTPYLLYFDKETKHLIRIAANGDWAGRKGKMVTDMSDHRAIDGVVMSRRSVMSFDGAKILEEEVVSVDWEDVGADAFARPPRSPLDTPKKRTTGEHVAAVAVHKGNYETIGRTIGALMAWIGRAGRTPMGPPHLVYLKGPRKTDDPEEYVTEIRVPLARPSTEAPASRDYEVRRIEPSTVAYMAVEGPYDEVASKYAKLFEWAKKTGYRITGAPQMIAFSDPISTPPRKRLSQLLVPIAKGEETTSAAPRAAKRARRARSASGR